MRLEFSAGIFIYKYVGGKPSFLFMKRSRFLDLPKGHIENGENAYLAAIRETKEEAGVAVKPLPFFKHQMNYYFKDGKIPIRKKVTMFLAEMPAGQKVTVSKEHVGYEWLTFEEALRSTKFKEHKALISRANEYVSRMERMGKINADYSKLPESRQNWLLSRRFVNGEGPLDAKIMFIGQAPGDSEDRSGRPFVGRSGRLLDALIHSAGLNRQNLYITSTVQFFPPKNRIPTDEEIEACRPYLMAQIELIKPKLVVLVGSIAMKEFTGMEGIMGVHGKLIKRPEASYFVTLHPAAAVRINKNLPLIESDFQKLKQIAKSMRI